jgi:hypothetical protein
VRAAFSYPGALDIRFAAVYVSAQHKPPVNPGVINLPALVVILSVAVTWLAGSSAMIRRRNRRAYGIHSSRRASVNDLLR